MRVLRYVRRAMATIPRLREPSHRIAVFGTMHSASGDRKQITTFQAAPGAQSLSAVPHQSHERSNLAAMKNTSFQRKVAATPPTSQFPSRGFRTARSGPRVSAEGSAVHECTCSATL